MRPPLAHQWAVKMHSTLSPSTRHTLTHTDTHTHRTRTNIQINREGGRVDFVLKLNVMMTQLPQ